MSTTQEEDTNIYFVVPNKYSDEERCNTDTKMAFQSCVEHDLHPEWVTEEQVLKMEPAKRHVFVFEEFSGSAFDFLKNLKSLVVGVRCILACLIKGTSIPEGVSPVFTVAMRDLLITTTGFDESTKKALVEKVEYMGAVYSAKLRKTVTHVVAHTVGSTKHQMAIASGIPLMNEQWVWAVWEASRQRNVHATDEEFMKYKCPIFHGLVITCSGLPRHEKESLKELIFSNGGEFSGVLESERTKVLIVSEPTGEKYKFASRCKLPCVLPSWVYDSVKKGHALPIEPYQLQTPARSCSTPETDKSRFLPDISGLSTIQGNERQIDETIISTTDVSVRPSFALTKEYTEVSDVDKYMEMVDKLDIAEAKKAKVFLDGCSVYLSGFSPERTEKLRRILNEGGATRFNEISDSVTHVILGDFIPSDIKLLKTSIYRPHVVTVEWLIESIRLCSPAPEEQFTCFQHSLPPVAAEPPSPLSKKGLQLLQNPQQINVRALDLTSDRQEEENLKVQDGARTDLVQQYLQANLSSDDKTIQNKEHTNRDSRSATNPILEKEDNFGGGGGRESDSSCAATTTQEASTLAEILKDLTFAICGYEEALLKEMEDTIKECGGQVVGRSFKGIPDYGIVPVHGGSLFHTTNEIVTHLWLTDCLEQEALLPVKYYHQPISVNLNMKPLAGCVMGITTYSGVCRAFVMELAQLLGAETQEMFARVNSKAKKAKASSHLICPAPGGQKYKAACKWKLPAITHEWLLACAREGRRVAEEPYLVKENSPSVSELKIHDITTSGIFRVPDAQQSSGSHHSAEAEVRQDEVAELMVPPNRASVEADSSNGTGQFRRGSIDTAPTDSFSSPEVRQGSSSGTPVADQNLLHYDLSQPTPKGPNYISTPETPYGAVFKPDPSPNTRKKWKRYIDNFPQFPLDQPPLKKRRESTPLSEIKRQIWSKILPNQNANGTQKTGSEKECEDLDSVRQRLSLSDSDATKEYNQQDISDAHNLHDNTNNDSNLSKEYGEDTTTMLQKVESQSTTRSSPASTGINTQLMELNEILTSGSKSALLKSSRGSSVRMSVDTLLDGAYVKAAQANALPESLDINADCVHWVDPVITQDVDESLKTTNKPAPMFMLSSIEDRDRCEEIITVLGGTVSTVTGFDPCATHLVCTRPARSEKLLASIASGKWVLHRDYLNECEKQHSFITEEEFEWGNPKATNITSSLKRDSMEFLLAKAAYRWRCKLSDSQCGAFSGMKAIILTSQEKSESFKRLVIAGGGEVLNVRLPFSNPGNATICLLDQNKVNTSIDMKALAEHNIPCVFPIYLSNFLIMDPPPQPLSCAIPQYKTLLNLNK